MYCHLVALKTKRESYKNESKITIHRAIPIKLMKIEIN